MILKECNLKHDSPEVLIYNWFYQDRAQNFTNYCPLFWLAFLALILSPFKLIFNGLMYLSRLLDSAFEKMISTKRLVNLGRQAELLIENATFDDLSDYNLEDYLTRSSVSYRLYAYMVCNYGITNSSIVGIMNIKAKRAGIPLFKADTPDEIKDGRVDEVNELRQWLSDEYMALANKELEVSRNRAQLRNEGYLVQKAKDDAFDAKLDKVYTSLFGWLPNITKGDIIIWTKRITGWVLVLAVTVLVIFLGCELPTHGIADGMGFMSHNSH